MNVVNEKLKFAFRPFKPKKGFYKKTFSVYLLLIIVSNNTRSLVSNDRFLLIKFTFFKFSIWIECLRIITVLYRT